MNNSFMKCLIFLFKTPKDNKEWTSMDVDIMNTVKYDTNERWLIHNLSQQELSNPQLFKNFSFETKG
jgi:hypothetical protein